MLNTILLLAGVALIGLAAVCISRAGWAIAEPGDKHTKIARVAALMPTAVVLAFAGTALALTAVR